MQILRQQWFMVLLMLALGIGYAWGHSLQWLNQLAWLKWSIVATTMFLMTISLALKSLLESVSRPGPPAIATLINLLVAPLLAWPLSRLLGSELGDGLVLAMAVPSTLASAAVWTRRAGGNDCISIVVTIITNLVCFVVTPTWVFALTGTEIPADVFYSTIRNLFLYVVLPMLLAQSFRVHEKIADWATRNKPHLSLAAQIGILLIILLGSVSMRVRVDVGGHGMVDWQSVTGAIVTVFGLHLFLLWMGIAIGKWLGYPPEDRIAIGFSGSQKTLMVGLSTALSMGLNIIPIVAYHALQLIVDTYIADRYRLRLDNPQFPENQDASALPGKL